MEIVQEAGAVVVGSPENVHDVAVDLNDGGQWLTLKLK